MDILVDIPDNDLPKLSSLYKEHNTWAPHVYSFINIGIKWKKSQKYGKLITFMSPNNCWEKDGTIIVQLLFNRYDLFVFTLDKNCKNLYKGLMETQRINFNRKILILSVHKDHYTTIKKFIKNKEIKLIEEIKCITYLVPSETAKKFSTECPPEVYLKKLDVSLVPKINALWHHRFPNSEKYLSDLITMNGGYGLFLRSNNTLVSWVVKHILGNLGMLQTDSTYLKKGYASLVTKALAKDIGKEGFHPFATILIENHASISMFKKLGFHEIALSTYIVVGK